MRNLALLVVAARPAPIRRTSPPIPPSVVPPRVDRQRLKISKNPDTFGRRPDRRWGGGR